MEAVLRRGTCCSSRLPPVESRSRAVSGNDLCIDAGAQRHRERLVEFVQRECQAVILALRGSSWYQKRFGQS
jgi:hypothetical protein